MRTSLSSLAGRTGEKQYRRGEISNGTSDTDQAARRCSSHFVIEMLYGAGRVCQLLTLGLTVSTGHRPHRDREDYIERQPACAQLPTCVANPR